MANDIVLRADRLLEFDSNDDTLKADMAQWMKDYSKYRAAATGETEEG